MNNNAKVNEIIHGSLDGIIVSMFTRYGGVPMPPTPVVYW